MLKYIITQYPNDTVLLEVANPDETGEKKLVQLTLKEFNVFMSYPAASREEIFNILWEQGDKSQGKAALTETVNTVFEILGRD